jgi:hypothetical protein
MRKTKKDLISDFDSILQGFNKKYPLSSKEFNHLYNKRIYGNSLLLRPFLSKLIYELGAKSDWKIHLRLFALVEVINISTYQSNLAFDNKNGIKNELDKFNQIISSFFSTFIFFDEIIISQYDDNKRLKIIDATVKGLEEIYYGQYLDLNVLNFSNESLYNSFEEFEEKYKLRCQHLGSSLINLCINYCLILNDSKIDEIKNELVRFGTLFGLAGQILNDLGDITSKGRVYSTNRYSDIENERLTLPILFLMQIGGDKRPSKEHLVELCKNDTAIAELIDKVKSYLTYYINEINGLMEAMDAKGFNINEIQFLSNMLEKSNFLKLKNHVY